MPIYNNISIRVAVTYAKNSLLLGPDGVYTISELLGLGVVGKFRLHPDHVAVWGVGNRAVDGGLASTLVSVVSLTCPGSIPVEVDIDTSETLGNRTRLSVAFALALLQELANEVFLVDMNASVDGVNHSLVEQFQVGLLCPCILNRLELVAVLSCLLGSKHEFTKRLKGRVCAAQDIVVVAWVDG